MVQYVRFVSKTYPTPTYGIITKSGEICPVEDPFKAGFKQATAAGSTIALKDVTLLAPVKPTKIIGIGRNYRDHAAELGNAVPVEPLVFIKALSSLNHPNRAIEYNSHCTEVHYEGELAVVMGRECKNISEADALQYVAGYTIANDVTDRVIQKKEPTFARGKGMDTFCPVGPFLVTGIEWKSRRVRTWVNEQLKQDGNTNDMIFSVPYLIHFVSQFITLLPGDLILTGTPKGVGAVKPGDKIKIEIDDLGVLENSVELLRDIKDT